VLIDVIESSERGQPTIQVIMMAWGGQSRHSIYILPQVQSDSPVTAKEGAALSFGIRHPHPGCSKGSQLNDFFRLGLENPLHLPPTDHDLIHLLLRKQLLLPLAARRRRRFEQHTPQILILREIDMGRRPHLLIQVGHGGDECGTGVVGFDVVQGALGGDGEGHGHEILGESEAVEANAFPRPLGVYGEVVGLGFELPWGRVAYVTGRERYCELEVLPDWVSGMRLTR
jgi:hypothetical protein